MEKHFCNYNQSLAIKELGFNEPCLGFYFFCPVARVRDEKLDEIGI